MYARRSFVLAVVVLAVLATGIYYAAPRIGPTDQAAAYDEKLAAAKTMESAEMAILDARREQAESSTLADDPHARETLDGYVDSGHPLRASDDGNPC